ncbi:MAG: DUF4190 domain-containing protein [Bacteroidota bacterium]|nr:DUF4190 domain-containing protein [Bacteroidota bacterium]
MKKLLLILPFIILFSCSVQKRKYQKGFYLSSNKSKTVNKKETTVSAKKRPGSGNPELKPATVITEINTELEVSTDKKILPVKSIKNPLITLSKDEPCDKITFKNGDEISVKILEIAPFDIKYKKCDSPDGPSYIIKKSTVFMITYANGTKEVFKAEPEVKPSNNNSSNSNSNSNKGPSIPESAVISLIAGICGFVIFIGSIPAICFGIAAIRKINREPEKYTGKGMASTGIILGVLGVIGKILLFALIFAL